MLYSFFAALRCLHGRNIDKHALYTNFFAIPAILVYAFALLDKRKNFYKGEMTYKQGFFTGLIITLMVTILSPLTQYITSNFITPEYFPNMIEFVVSEGKMTREAAESQFNLQSYILQGMLGTLVLGLVTSAIVAIFTRKKN
ncbi:MAG: DUF4199 domain-containing protein [Bacteroidales bacterium]